jgi:Na+/H+ antiporter NhaA
MSLFIADLAFADGAALGLAKIGILGASVVAGVGGYLVLRRATRITPEDRAPGPRVPASPPLG